MYISLFISNLDPRDQNSINLYNEYYTLYEQNIIKKPIIYCDQNQIFIDRNIAVFKPTYIKNASIKQNILCSDKDYNLLENINIYHNVYIVDSVSIKDTVNKILIGGNTNEL